MAAIFFCSIGLLAGEIHDVVASGDLQSVKNMIEENPKLLENRDDGGNTPLLGAALEGQIEIFQFLIDNGANLRAVNNRGSSVMNLAAYNGKTEMIRLLLKLGFNMDYTTITGMTPLMQASYNGHTEAVRLLLDNGANLEISDSTHGGCAIHWACYRGNDETRDLLLSRGADLNKPSLTDGSTPLIWAAYVGNLDATRWLMTHGVGVNAAMSNGWTALHNAVMQNSIDLVKYLLENGANFNAMTGTDLTPFLLAVQNGNIDLTNLFLDKGADINARAAQGESPLQLAVFGGNIDLIKLLISKGANVNESNESGTSALYNTTYRGNTEIASLLIDAGAQVNICSREGTSPLVNAIIQGYNEIAGLLINNNADLNFKDTILGRTGLHLAAIKGNSEAAEMMLEKGATVNAKDKKGHTPLYYAGKYGHKDIADLLISRGGKAKKPEENYGWSPHLNENIAVGEAYIWYLGHCGYAIKTANNLLIFDYQNGSLNPETPSLANGHINPAEITGQNVYVFVSHDHQDHFDSTIFSWTESLKSCQYIFGFRLEDLPQYRDSGRAIPAYQYLAPRESRTIDNMEITTIKSNDAGVGFLIKVDGLEIYFAGDHAGWREGQKEGFTSEVDYLTERVTNPDFAFVNVTGCHAQDTAALAEGTRYTLEKLKPQWWFPTHGLNREYIYGIFAQKASLRDLPSKATLPENRGDSFHYVKEKQNL
jgi:ankyrin repeat protein/L-ascorbate metabolism protein UlaG (beta-lactamase superfamily)